MRTRQIFLTSKLSVIKGAGVGIEFMWRGAEKWFGRLSVWEEEKAMKIATRIEASASTEAEAEAIFEEFEEMS